MTFVQRFLLFLLLLSAGLFTRAGAQDSCGLRVTLLTCSPGYELYSTFGHTAIRVQDGAGNDLVYNYGTFEFGDDFYMKFVRGKLPYYLSVEPFAAHSREEWGFIDQYSAENRAVWEQEVLLDCPQKAALVASLNRNALPENRQYRYDFLFDNCTTRSGNMIAAAAPAPVLRTRIIPTNPKDAPTFRNLIHEYLDRGRQPWSKLGIDLLLGARLDRRASNQEAQFLPEKLMAGMKGATAAGRPLLGPQKPVLTASPQKPEAVFTPGMAFGLLLLLVTILSFVPARRAQATIRVFDFVLFLLAGLVGVLLLFMWFGTDHALCANNWNLVWAMPTHLVAVPFLRSSRRWVNWYLFATTFILSALLIGWIFLPQQLNLNFLPIVLLLLLRAWLIILKPHYNAPSVAPQPENTLSS